MTLAYILIYFTSIIAFSNILYSTLEMYFINDKKDDLKRYSNLLASDIAANGYLHNASRESLTDDMDNASKLYEARIMLLNDQGFVIYDTKKIENGKMLASEEVIKALSDRENIKELGKVINVFTPIKNDESEKVTGVIILSNSLEDLYEMIDIIQEIIVNLLIIIGIVVAFVYIYFTGVTVRPLHQLLRAINNISKGHLDEKVNIKTKNEFAKLGNAFNNMTDRLYRMDQSRSEFVSNVSHELKTPLSSIKVLTESLLLQENLPEELYKEFLTDINSEIDRQTAIINDLLTLVRLDEKDKELNVKSVDLNDMIEKILKRLQPLAVQKNVELILENNRQVNAEIDEMKMTLAMSNLVENGIKYNKEKGKVIVTIDSGHDDAYVTVTDTGIGIPKEHFEKLFERFYRVDKTRDRSTGGTGLGLSIAHRSILLHKGSINVESELDIGTRFFITIPLRRNQK